MPEQHLGRGLHQPQRLDELAFAAIAHPPFKEPPQMLERFRQCPILQGSRLIERAGLLLEERQIVLRVEDELATTIDARCRAISLAPQMIATSSTKPFTRTSRKP
jgi:hypothetical protein